MFEFVFAALIVLVTAILYVWPRTAYQLKHLPSVPFSITYKMLFDAQTGFTDQYKRLSASIKGNSRAYLRDLGNLRFVVFGTPEAAKIILDQNNFEKLIFADRKFMGIPTFGTFIFGKNIVQSNGAEWHKHKNVAKPAFSRPLKIPVFITSVSKLLTTLHNLPDKNVEIYVWMQRLTLDVLGQAIFSFDFGSLKDEDGGPYVLMWKEISSRIFKLYYAIFPFLCALPTKWTQETWGYCRQFKGLMQRMVDERKKELKAGVVKEEKDMDLLDMMIAAESSDSKLSTHWTSDDLVYNLGIFFVAGHDTTSNALSVSLYHLAKDRKLQDRAREEVYSVLGKPKNRQEAIEVGPDQTSIGRLTFINCVIKEALRLFPSVPALGFRKALNDIPVTYVDQDGTKKTVIVPKGHLANVDVIGMHHDPYYYSEPEKFNPDRWLNDKGDDGVKPWMPFGGGARICLGMQFSLVEQKVALAMLLRNFSFELEKVDGEYPEYKTYPAQLLRPRDLKLKLIPIV